MSVRKIPKNYRNITGVISSMKSISLKGYESSLERDFITLLEFNTNVINYDVQPISINWVDNNGKQRLYTPDTLVFYKDSNVPILYEVKYRSDLKKDWDSLKLKFKAAISFCKSKNWHFKIVTEQEIRTSYLENAKFLLPYLLK